MDFSNVKQMLIEVNGVQKEVSQLQDSNGNVIWKKEDEHVLPSEYQRVEYVESSGHTQYINTGVSDQISTLRIELDQQINNVTQESYAVQGMGQWGGSYGYVLKIPGSCHAANLSIGSGRYDSAFVSVTNDHLRHLYVVDCVTEKVYVDSNEYSFTKEDPTVSYGSIFLFGFGDNNVFKVGVDMKLYSCKIYTNNTLVRNFIPCYRKSDDEPGLYDLIGEEFYVNQGSGDFTAGQPIIPITQGISTISINLAQVTIKGITESVSAVTNSNNANKAVSDTISDITLTMPTITITQISESVGTDFNV